MYNLKLIKNVCKMKKYFSNLYIFFKYKANKLYYTHKLALSLYRISRYVSGIFSD